MWHAYGAMREGSQNLGEAILSHQRERLRILSNVALMTPQRIAGPDNAVVLIRLFEY